MSVQTIIQGPIIITRYLGPTDYRPSRIVATHRRESSRSDCRPWRKITEWDHTLNAPENHRAAAEALLAAWPYETCLQIVGRGHDADAYYWLCSVTN
jgi:hypothetical protein